MFQKIRELEEAMQNLFTELVPDEVTVSKESLLQVAASLLDNNFQVQSEKGSRKYFQTVRVVREQRVWVPITLHYQVGEDGVVDFIRIHAPKYIVERKK